MFQRLLVPLDGSATGEASLPYLQVLASHFAAEITLLQVVEPGQHVHTVGGLGYVIFPEQEMESLKEKAGRYLQHAGSQLADTMATIKYQVRTGNIAQEIINSADETNADLVVVSTRRHSGIGYHGSIAQKLLHAGHTPILVIRSPVIGS